MSKLFLSSSSYECIYQLIDIKLPLICQILPAHAKRISERFSPTGVRSLDWSPIEARFSEKVLGKVSSKGVWKRPAQPPLKGPEMARKGFRSARANKQTSNFFVIISSTMEAH